MLISLDNKYYLKNDSDKSIMLCTRAKGKKGDYIYSAKGYYTSLASALKGYMAIVTITSDLSSIKEVIELQNTIKEKVEKICQK